MNPTLRIAREVPTTEAEGPGRRYAVWVQGCSLRCPGCCNPEMFVATGGNGVPVDGLTRRILETPDIEGISLLGGEPFEQPEPLVQLCRSVRERGLSVMIFSGYRLEELTQNANPAVAQLLAETDLLIDGRFEQSLKDSGRRWIGSSNQRAHFLTRFYSPDDPRFRERNTFEIRLVNGEVIVNGWPDPADRIRG